ncbi:MAG: GNAT family N-acetyltransferase [Ardenticatenaceae bacterium]
MTLPALETYQLILGEELDDEYYQLLQHKLRDYNRRAAPRMEPPEAIPLNIRVVDGSGQTAGGLAGLTYWEWLVIKLLVLDDRLRGNGLGQRVIQLAHAEARRRGCTSAQTATYDFQALKFYQRQGYRIVGRLADYPDGYDYYWLRKDFEEDDAATDKAQATAGSDDVISIDGL